MKAVKNWSRDELLLAFRLYCRTPFGRLHRHNPDIIDLAQRLGRTPSSIAMKACNFASLDPVHRDRNISALGNVSRADRELWRDFGNDAESIAADAEEAFARLKSGSAEMVDEEFEEPVGPTEREQLVRVRRVQRFFRAAVLTSYGFRCAVSGIALPELLTASHILPWSECPARRADPRNGIALNALYDRAFDRGLITFDESWRLVISSQLKSNDAPEYQLRSFRDVEGQPMRLPPRFTPDPLAMAHHREHLFRP